MYYQNINHLAMGNNNLRQIVHTTPNSQVAVLNLRAGDEITGDVRIGSDGLFFVIEGSAEAAVDGQDMLLGEQYFLLAPSGSMYTIRNTGDGELKLCAVYAPPIYADRLVQSSSQGELAGEFTIPSYEFEVVDGELVEDIYA
jgi:mannose-6-phosphate isomerase-like protein (cupin superfamily)